MKNLVATLVLTTCFLNVSAQQPNFIGHEEIPDAKKTLQQGWYNMGQMIYDLGNSKFYFAGMWPDSTMHYPSGSSVWMHSYGQTFDPTDPTWQLGGYQTIDSFTNYTVDSVLIWYRYYRPQKGNPDTLMVHVYTGDSMRDFEYNSETSMNPYYDTSTRMGSKFTKEYVVLLDDDDTMYRGYRALKLPINMEIPAGDELAVTFTYFPGNPYEIGDTITGSSTSQPNKKLNTFVTFQFHDLDNFLEYGYFNHSARANNRVRYGMDTTWDAFLPGNFGWINISDHCDMAFHLQETVNVNELELSSLRIGPNPANEHVTIQMMGNATLEDIRLLDLTGKEVTAPFDLSKATVDVSSLKSGHYVLQLVVDGRMHTQKLEVKH